MNVELVISTQTLGDFNTDADNQRYADAVKAEIELQYPNASVSVELVSNVCSNSYFASNDEIGEVAENLQRIANDVWDDANY